MAGASNRPHGLWFPLLFVVAGGIAIIVGLVVTNLFVVLWGAIFGGVGAVFAIVSLRSHKRATPSTTTVSLLSARGWQDRTTEVRAARRLPEAVVAHLKLRDHNHAEVARLAGIEPEQPQVAAVHPELWDDLVSVAESWVVTATHSTNDRVTGGNVEPRVAAWLTLPAPVGNITIRPDNARMKLADLTGVATDHTVDWDAVDTTWHLHGDDEALLRAVVDIGLMGRLADLPGRWIVRFVGDLLLVIPTTEKNKLTARPPTLGDVADEIGDVVVAIRSILPQLLWSDLDDFLSGYRS